MFFDFFAEMLLNVHGFSAEFRFDTAENKPAKNLQNLHKEMQRLPSLLMLSGTSMGGSAWPGRRRPPGASDGTWSSASRPAAGSEGGIRELYKYELLSKCQFFRSIRYVRQILPL